MGLFCARRWRRAAVAWRRGGQRGAEVREVALGAAFGDGTDVVGVPEGAAGDGVRLRAAKMASVSASQRRGRRPGRGCPGSGADG
jgi:hypothetical protein